MDLDALESERLHTGKLCTVVAVIRMHAAKRENARLRRAGVCLRRQRIEFFNLLRTCHNRQDDRIINPRLTHRALKVAVGRAGIRARTGHRLQFFQNAVRNFFGERMGMKIDNHSICLLNTNKNVVYCAISIPHFVFFVNFTFRVQSSAEPWSPCCSSRRFPRRMLHPACGSAS